MVVHEISERSAEDPIRPKANKEPMMVDAVNGGFSVLPHHADPSK